MSRASFHHVLSPHGWAAWRFPAPADQQAVEEAFAARGEIPRARPEPPRPWLCVYLWPALELPRWRTMDVGHHAKAITPSVTSACLAHGEPPRSGAVRWAELKLGGRHYRVTLVPDAAMAAPPGGFAHRLYILCKASECDLSPLFALAGPRDFPELAAAVTRAYYVGPEPHLRWVPGCEYVDCGNVRGIREGEEALAKTALDILADERRLRALIRLTHDLSPDARAEGFELGLWTVSPREAPGADGLWRVLEAHVQRRDLAAVEDAIATLRRLLAGERVEGEFTTAASLALMYIAHMVPFPRITDRLRLPA
ncbi:MAG: hypothetical protein LM577_05600 [Thermoproteaceae archaeon]|nr:hypothetical protein [Thermoproteaceae archaeon]